MTKVRAQHFLAHPTDPAAEPLAAGQIVDVDEKDSHTKGLIEGGYLVRVSKREAAEAEQHQPQTPSQTAAP